MLDPFSLSHQLTTLFTERGMHCNYDLAKLLFLDRTKIDLEDIYVLSFLA